MVPHWRLVQGLVWNGHLRLVCLVQDRLDKGPLGLGSWTAFLLSHRRVKGVPLVLGKLAFPPLHESVNKLGGGAVRGDPVVILGDPCGPSATGVWSGPTFKKNKQGWGLIKLEGELHQSHWS